MANLRTHFFIGQGHYYVLAADPVKPLGNDSPGAFFFPGPRMIPAFPPYLIAFITRAIDSALAAYPFGLKVWSEYPFIMPFSTSGATYPSTTYMQCQQGFLLTNFNILIYFFILTPQKNILLSNIKVF